MSSITIPVSKKERERLSRLALQYGFSVSEFSRRILNEIVSEIPNESLNEYERPEALRASLTRAVRDWKKGRVRIRICRD